MTFFDDYNEEFNAFFLNISWSSKTVTQFKLDFLAALFQQYASKPDELCSRIQNNERLIVKNSVIKSNEQISNKWKRDDDNNDGDEDSEKKNSADGKKNNEKDLKEHDDEDSHKSGV